ncbi:hypothetical protein D3C79_916750 [compost metagenome]
MVQQAMRAGGEGQQVDQHVQPGEEPLQRSRAFEGGYAIDLARGAGPAAHVITRRRQPLRHRCANRAQAHHADPEIPRLALHRALPVLAGIAGDHPVEAPVKVQHAPMHVLAHALGVVRVDHPAHGQRRIA